MEIWTRDRNMGKNYYIPTGNRKHMVKGMAFLLTVALAMGIFMLAFAGCGAAEEEGDATADPAALEAVTAGPADDSGEEETETTTQAVNMETLAYTDDMVTEDDEDINGISMLGTSEELLAEAGLATGEDTYGQYVVYQGGEMYLPCEIGVQGDLSEAGVGLFLYLDGEPQPYRVEGGDGNGDTSYAYMHVFYLTEDEDQVCEVYFTPVTGEEGDVLEYYFGAIPRPYYFPSEFSRQPWLLSYGLLSGGGRISFEVDPGTCESVETADYGAVCTVSYEDLQTGESMSASSAYTYKWYIDGKKAVEKGIAYGVSEGDTLTIRFEIYGTVYETFGLTFYIDNEPILIDGGAIRIQNQSGQKTVVELELTLTDFDGSGILYAAITPQNYTELFSSGLTTPEWFAMTDTLYFTSAKTMEEMVYGEQ